MSDTLRLDPETLLTAYAQGVFPMSDRDGTVRWYTADPRGVLPLDELHVPKTLATLVRQQKFDVRINYDFEATMRGCMSNREEGSWISDDLIAAYKRLHELGFAHSVETWLNGQLVGGLYGVSLGGAFFGESMFHRVSDASKVALVHLVNRLNERGYQLLDTQASTEHLRRFGCIDIPASQYLRLLKSAMKKQCVFG
ncbi:MAG TPA: leucyl/phenylalanyl-tRNA--protein transferase [Tepidisphaeraceae bacterium]|jgi:leucyl/phenylalanyl-tRNA--protein transferase|nr:leucyl/phenylalanyl-tRNA--protein transferase [Tepidisphaeraceae bacterium]